MIYNLELHPFFPVAALPISRASMTINSQIANYRPLGPQDRTPAEFAAQLDQCQTCEHRIRAHCHKAKQRVAIIARRKNLRCPLSGDQPLTSPSAPLPLCPLPIQISLETPRIAREVTIGITAFGRPHCVERLVSSIRRYYPTVKILIADNGDQPAQVPGDPQLTYLCLPYDCGLSASRNAIIDHLQTPYLWLLDDDFVFSGESDATPFLDVLDADPAIGVAGGVIHDHRANRAGVVSCTWALDFERGEDGKLYGRAATSPARRTPAGTHYYLADTIHNFCVFRREMLLEHRWDERLKVQEHFDYYLQVQAAARWKVACVESVRVNHFRESDPTYNLHRNRNQEFYRLGFAKWAISGFDPLKYEQLAPRSQGRPNIVLLGIGHSGTSIATRLLHHLGWAAGDADAEFSESVSCREINERFLREQIFDAPAAALALARLPKPWAIKDPRLVETLPQWRSAMAPYRPLLIWLTRDRQAVEASHHRRGESRIRGGSYTRAFERCRAQFAAWPFAKLRLDFEQLLAAAALIDRTRPINEGFDFDLTIQGGAEYRPSGDNWHIISSRQEFRRPQTMREIAELGLKISSNRVHLTPNGECGWKYKLKTIRRLGISRFFDDDIWVISQGKKTVPNCEFILAQPQQNPLAGGSVPG